jgi:hypothetical protein
MTLMMEASPATVVDEPPVQPSTSEALDSWARVAARAHALLTQTLPDDELDALLEAPVRLERPFLLPPVLFG